ncbi:hypothetical protein U9M48_022388 [Paspalum notatum var. saurae]|uniref:ATP-dependent DNA helicase n=1 Tax=Paspalum notatum var. saurae TaxID=547442 RepID=A0AAQ3THM9_PASNO
MHTPSPTPHLEAQAPALCPISPRASAADVRHRRLRSTTRPRRRGPHAALAPTREPTGPRRHARQQSRTAAADAASTTDVAAEGDQDESNLRSPVIDAKERKRQRDRERYATLSVEKRNEINKKRREARQRNKGWSIMTVSSTADMDTGTQQLHQVETWLLVQSDPWFAEYLLRIEDGTEETNSCDEIRLPDEVCVPYTGSDIDLDGLIDCIFPRFDENMSNPSYITLRAMLSTRNDWVDMINMRMIGRFQGDQMVYHSFDSAVDDPHNYEFLNTLTPNLHTF